MISPSFAFVRFVISRLSVVFGIVRSMFDHGPHLWSLLDSLHKRRVESLVYTCAERDPSRDGRN